MFLEGLDALDQRIVQLLIENARMSYSDIGQAVGISRVAVKARIQALEPTFEPFPGVEASLRQLHAVADVAVSVQVTERKDRVKLSFRSKGDIPVNLWAKTHFNGGGHLNAAGGHMPLPLEDAIQKLKDTTGWFFGELLKAKYSSR